jgi:hypothetical protein
MAPDCHASGCTNEQEVIAEMDRDDGTTMRVKLCEMCGESETAAPSTAEIVGDV